MNLLIPILIMLTGIIIIVVSGIKKYNNSTQVIYTPLIIVGSLIFIVGVIILIVKNEPDAYRDYLKHVYPAMDMTRSSNEYKDLYNSLGWYYQCCSSNQSYVTPTGSGTWNVSGPVATGPQGEKADILRYIPNVSSNDWNWDLPGKSVLWKSMRCCTSTYKLPSIPLGNLYDWYSLQYFNVPVISNTKDGWNFAGSASNLRDSKRQVNTVASQSPNTSFSGLRLTNYKYNGYEITPSDPLGLKNNIPLGLWAGPGPFYAGERAIMRAMYYPNGPQYSPEQSAWKMSQDLNGSNWLGQYLQRSNLQGKDRNNNNKLWVDGFDKGDYMEIGHVQQIPGMVQSTGYWFNYFGGGGTGVFHKVGKTPKVTQDSVDAMKKSIPTKGGPIIDLANHSPRNKAHALFTLLWEVKNTKTLLQPSGAVAHSTKTYSSGSELLKGLYGTDDPWFITMWHANGYAPTDNKTGWSSFTESYEPLGKPIPDFTSQDSGQGMSDPLSWANPPWINGGGGPNMKLISGQVDTAFAKSIKQLGVYPVNTGSNQQIIKLYGLMGDEVSGVLFATLCAFLLQAEFGDTDELENYVTPPAKVGNIYNTQPDLFGEQFPSSGIPGVGALTEKGMRYSLTKVFMGNWFYDRVSNGVSFDEPINYFSCVLGYEDIQMTCNTNTNGLWSFETIYTGLPKKEDGLPFSDWDYTWHDSVVSKRLYPYISGTTYMGPATSVFNQLFASRTSQRDPFDMSKEMPCYNLGGIKCSGTPGVTCNKGAPIGYGWKEFEGTCTADDNVGMTIGKSHTTSVLWDKNDMCHPPWGLDSYGSDGVLWGQANGFGHSYCQAPGDDPTLSSIWANVPYGGSGYGTGIVPLMSPTYK